MATVTVACKLPHGLILEVTKPDGSTVTKLVNGALHKDAADGYGITEVDKELWDAWFAAKKDWFPAIKNKHIFAAAKVADAKAAAADDQSGKTGLEALNPESLPKNIGKVDGTTEGA